MKNAPLVKKALVVAVNEALDAHYREHGTFRNLDWFNASAKTTDFYAQQLKAAKTA